MLFLYSSSNLKSIEICFFSGIHCIFLMVIAEFVLPKKYLLELGKYILCMFVKILCICFSIFEML